jgi:hypothetical protein
MKISELVQALQHQQNLWGDLPVYHDRPGDSYSIPEQIETVRPIEHDTIGKPPEAIELI